MSVKTEIPGVNNAVQKLEELADRMLSDDFGFHNKDVDNIDKVIDALHQLETERKAMHDLLETETIKASILRHQLKQLPKTIRHEAMSTVMSSRESNAMRHLELQGEMAQMNAEIIALDKRSRELEQENAVLHPERELLKQQHAEIISQMNQRMAEKAELQIALNETRDEVRHANQDIVDLEDGILQLKEDLIQERMAGREEKKRLRKAVNDTTQKTQEQKDQNVLKKRELDSVQEKLLESEGNLDSVSKSIQRYETSQAKLEGEERALTAQLAKQLTMNDQLRIKGAQIMNERIQESRDFEEAEKALLEKIEQYEQEIQTKLAQQKQLEKQKEQLLEDLEEKEAIMAEDTEKVAVADEQLQQRKALLNQKAEEMGLMQQEIIAMQQELAALVESHQAVLAQLNKQIEEYKERLARVKKERLELQGQKENVAKNLDDIRTEAAKVLSEITNVVQNGKKQHTELSNEGIQLQGQLKEDENMISELTKSLEQAQRAFEDMFSEYQHRLTTMKAELIALEQALDEKTKELERRMPIFQDLEQYFNQRTTEYDAFKKELAKMKIKKQSLDDEIKRIQKAKEAVVTPQPQLREDLKTKRGLLMHDLKNHGDATQAKEREIFQVGCKLRALMEENKKFEDSCKKLEDDLADLQKQMEDNEKRKEQLQAQLIKEKEELIKKWETDAIMIEFFASRDEATAEAFGRLLLRTEKRGSKINVITERLEEELYVLSGFLDTMSTRRPKRQQKLDSKSKRQLRKLRSQDESEQRGRYSSGGQSRRSSRSCESRGRSLQSPQSPRRDKSKSPKRRPTPRSKEPTQLRSSDAWKSEISDDQRT